LGAARGHSSGASATRALSLRSSEMRVARSARPASPSVLRAASRYHLVASSRRPRRNAYSPAMAAVRVCASSTGGGFASPETGARQAANSRIGGRKRSVTGIWRNRAVKCRPQVQRAYRKRLNAGAPVPLPRAGSPPSMSLFALGINHQTAPVALRERVAFSDDAIAPALAQLRALPQV